MKKSDRRQTKSDLFKNAVLISNFTSSIKFAGTDNPRYLRAIQALLVSHMPREDLDRVVGCSNGPALIANLRDLGLGQQGLLCTMIPDHDRDGNPVRRGVYHFSDAGRRAVNAWLRTRKGVFNAGRN